MIEEICLKNDILHSLHDGISSLHDGISSLHDGISSLHDGISSFKFTNFDIIFQCFEGKNKNLYRNQKHKFELHVIILIC